MDNYKRKVGSQSIYMEWELEKGVRKNKSGDDRNSAPCY